MKKKKKKDKKSHFSCCCQALALSIFISEGPMRHLKGFHFMITINSVSQSKRNLRNVNLSNNLATLTAFKFVSFLWIVIGKQFSSDRFFTLKKTQKTLNLETNLKPSKWIKLVLILLLCILTEHLLFCSLAWSMLQVNSPLA